MTKHFQSPWGVSEKHARRLKKIKRNTAKALIVCLGLLFLAIVFQPTKTAQAPQNVASKAVEPVAEPYVIPDPCGLTDVVCPGELGWDSIGMLYTRIQEAAGWAGVDPELAVRVANCESGLDPSKKNPNSSASGLYQFIDSTWEYIGAPGDRFNSDDSIAAFVEWFPKHPEWWNASESCWINQ